MNLNALLSRRAAEARPVRVLLIGAGKFGSMFLAQARHSPGLHVAAVCDLAPARARASLARVDWSEESFGARTLDAALADHTTFVHDDANALIRASGIEVVIDATGNPLAGVRHALACCEHRKHIVMVNVEADALAGPLLAARARAAGIVYSLAYGDQPALICEMVDWARAAGFEVVAAGKGTKYLPGYHESTPDTVWQHYGFSAQEVAEGDFNAQMFNSFLDGTKSAIEMAAVCNATGLMPAPDGLQFPACGVDELAQALRPAAEGGLLHHRGQVEVVSCMHPDGRPVERDLRWGVYTVFAAGSDYVRRCFREYGLRTDESGTYSAMYKPFHLIGLELGISVASVALRGEPTGAPDAFRADAIAVAKRDLRAGETLDGEGGHTVYGKLVPAAESLRVGALPIGLAHACTLTRAVARHATVTWRDVTPIANEAAAVRREMERLYLPADSKPTRIVQGEPS
jgi:predicted homoserine dehydrogenase-like protein